MEPTAIQVLRKHIPEPTNQAETNDDIHIIKAMEEYAEAKLKNLGGIGHVIDPNCQHQDWGFVSVHGENKRKCKQCGELFWRYGL